MGKKRLIVESLKSKFSKSVQNAVLFVSFSGQYNDNPKYISEALHKAEPTIQIIWAISDNQTKYLPDYVDTTQFGSKEYYRLLKTCKVVVDNYTGAGSLGFYYVPGIWKKWLAYSKKQLCISTWHGSPLKHIGKDTLQRKPCGFATSSTYCVAGCRYTADRLAEAYCLTGKMKEYGTPRNDLLFKKIDTDQLKKKLGLPLQKRIVLYAPTFRDDLEWSGARQLKLMDISLLLDTMKKVFQEEFVFVFRAHPGVVDQMKSEGSLHFDNAQLFDGNIGNDMAEYLVCTDVLITDYSGSLFDYSLTHKPCFLFSPDRKHYEEVERGFYMPYDALPYPISVDFNELISNILAFDQSKQKIRVDQFLSRIGNTEDGNASDRVVRDIISFIS